MLPRLFKTEADIRKNQITTLQIFNDNVTEIIEGKEYQIPFKSGGNDLLLYIFLSNDFPNDKPLLKVLPPIVHHWVNSEGEIASAPGLLNFTRHSDLGRVVQAIIREFERTPPPLVSSCPNSAIVSPTIPILDGEQRSSPSFPTLPVIKNFSPPSHIPISSSPFPELHKLSLSDLQFINKNDDRLQEIVDELPFIKEQNKKFDETVVLIEELAEENLSKREQLENLKKGISLRIEEVTKLAFENERLHVIYQNLSDKYSPRNIQSQLRLAAGQAEEESEKIAENFLKGEIDVDKFVNQYIKTRKLCQMRKTKEEKLSHQLDSLERAGF